MIHPSCQTECTNRRKRRHIRAFDKMQLPCDKWHHYRFRLQTLIVQFIHCAKFAIKINDEDICISMRPERGAVLWTINSVQTTISANLRIRWTLRLFLCVLSTSICRLSFFFQSNLCRVTTPSNAFQLRWSESRHDDHEYSLKKDQKSLLNELSCLSPVDLREWKGKYEHSPVEPWK